MQTTCLLRCFQTTVKYFGQQETVREETVRRDWATPLAAVGAGMSSPECPEKDYVEPSSNAATRWVALTLAFVRGVGAKKYFNLDGASPISGSNFWSFSFSYILKSNHTVPSAACLAAEML